MEAATESWDLQEGFDLFAVVVDLQVQWLLADGRKACEKVD